MSSVLQAAFNKKKNDGSSITYEDIAKAMGVTTTKVHDWFDGKSKPLKIVDRQKLCQMLGLDYEAGMLDNEGPDATDWFEAQIDIKISDAYMPIVDYVCTNGNLSFKDLVDFLMIFDSTKKNTNHVRFDVLCYLYDKLSYGQYVILIIKMMREGLLDDIE